MGRRILASGFGSNTLTTGDNTWRDYEISARVRATGGRDVAIGVRVQGGKGYLFGPRLGLYDAVRNRTLAASSVPFDRRRYYQLRVVVRGKRLEGYVDGKRVVAYDGLELATGGISLRTTNRTRATFENVTVRHDP
jgi:hypothetical protein